MDDLVSGIVASIEEAVFDECKAKGRYDLLDAIREKGYEFTEDPDGFMRFRVAGEVVLVVTMDESGAVERMN